MRLKDRQTVFDIIIMVFGDMSGLMHVINNNDDLFDQNANFNVDGSVVNQSVVDYHTTKQILTY